MISRRSMLRTGALAAAATVGAPAILHAQTKTLKITTWGGKWGDIMKATVLPAFEKEFKCTVSVDQAFPYPPKLQASPKNDPLYDVLHDNSNNQWLALDNGLVMDRITVKRTAPGGGARISSDLYIQKIEVSGSNDGGPLTVRWGVSPL